ncbi:MAG: hypothetical protein R3B48_25165 [Kofleriaceae bacterium]
MSMVSAAFRPALRLSVGLVAGAALAGVALAPVAAHAEQVSAAEQAPPAPAAAPGRPRKVIVEPPPPIPDPAARELAEEANLVSDGPRSGWAFGVGAFGMQHVATLDDSARGGGLALRVGNAATPTTTIWLEVLGGAFTGGNSCAPENMSLRCRSRIESSNSLTVTAQTYLGSTMWLRAGGGFASYTQVVTADSLDREESRLARGGLGAVMGLGVDVVRWRRNRLALESLVSAHRFSTGWIIDFGFGFGLTRY